MSVLDVIKKTFERAKKNKFTFKFNKYKFNKYESVNQYPIKLSDFINKGNIGCNFYVTLYKCPCCKSNPLYKTVFPLGKEYKITTTKGFVYMEEVFTCATCYSIFTPVQDENLEYGEIFSIKLNDEIEYVKHLLPLNIFGILGGSN